MFTRTVSILLSQVFLTASMYGQGLTTTASKDDWEEINFEFNSSILTDGYPSLLRLGELLGKNPGFKVRLDGHTDRIGSEGYNQKLGLARANTVRSFLTKYGASAGQVEVATSGKKQPKVSGASNEGRFINRRVVMTVLDADGKTVGSGGVGDAIRSMPDFDKFMKAQEKCCADILKRLDRLDEIVAMLKELQASKELAALKGEVDALKQGQSDLKQQIAGLPKPPGTAEITDITRTTAAEAIEKARMKRFSLLGVNIGADGERRLTFTGKGRYFAPFKEGFAIQAEGEYMYYRDRQEGQFDFGIVDRFHPRVQAGLFTSFKHVNISGMQQGGTLGQAALTFDYIFKRGRAGVFGTKGFLNNALLNRRALTRNAFEESYLSLIDQVGVSTTLGLYGNNYLEGNLGYLKSRGNADRPGGTLRFVFPVHDKIAFTLEGGVNETFVGRENNGRVAAGIQFGNFLKPKEYAGVDHAIPVTIPRVRYEMLTRVVRTGNDPPVADAGPDQIGVPVGTVTLDGSASFDPDGDPITYQWTQIAGPSVAISGATAAKASFASSEGQSYSFRLTVKDDKGAQSIARAAVSTQKPEKIEAVRIVRFAANPATITPGQSSTIVWQVLNADEVTITGLGRVDANGGSSTVSPSETTQYRITAKNRAGEVNEALTITVQRPDARILACTAQPMNITAGESATIFYATQGADTVSISGIGTVEPSGNRVVSPEETTTYTITASNKFNQATCNVRIQVTQGQVPRIVRFTAAPMEVVKGQPSTLVWAVENATDVKISSIGAGVGPTGSQEIRPDQTTTYTLTATNKFGQVSATVTVTVTVPPVPPEPEKPKNPALTACSASPAISQKPGDPVTLTWTVANATAVSIAGIGTVPLNGPAVVKPLTDTVYVLTAASTATSTQATCQIPVTVKQTEPPTAIISGPATIDVFTRELTIDGSGSTNPAGGKLTYLWEPLETGASVLDQNQPQTRVQLIGLAGIHRIRLTVKNEFGQSSSAIVTINFRNTTVF